jgi:hypothetical protein
MALMWFAALQRDDAAAATTASLSGQIEREVRMTVMEGVRAVGMTLIREQEVWGWGATWASCRGNL